MTAFTHKLESTPVYLEAAQWPVGTPVRVVSTRPAIDDNWIVSKSRAKKPRWADCCSISKAHLTAI